MSKDVGSPALSVVNADQPEPASQLSPARAGIALEKQIRNQVGVAIAAANDAFQNNEQRLRSADARKAELNARKAELQRINAEIMERHAILGSGGEPELIGEEELLTLDREIAKADHLAAAARAASSHLEERRARAECGLPPSIERQQANGAAVIKEDLSGHPDRIRDLEREANILRAEYEGGIHALEEIARICRRPELNKDASMMRFKIIAVERPQNVPLQWMTEAKTMWCSFWHALLGDEATPTPKLVPPSSPAPEIHPHFRSR
jgi:hypothetical protein